MRGGLQLEEHYKEGSRTLKKCSFQEGEQKLLLKGFKGRSTCAMTLVEILETCVKFPNLCKISDENTLEEI